MPAGLPDDSLDNNKLANPSAGRKVYFSSFSGPKGSPFDKDTVATTSQNASTGALSTGMGFGSPPILNAAQLGITTNPNQSFSDDVTPGLTLPSGAAASDSRLVAIGGGRSIITSGLSVPSPYTAGFALCSAGNGGSRDAGAGPAFTGFNTKMVTTTASTANGVAIEAGFLNRSGVTLPVAGLSTQGSATAASAAPV